MNKRFLLAAVLLPLFFVVGAGSLLAQAVSDYMPWGYCDNMQPMEGKNAVGVAPPADGGSNLRVGAWARMKASDLRKLKGCRIIGLRIGAGAGVKNAEVALLSSIQSDAQTITSSKTELKFGWQEVLFPSPIQIDGSRKEIVYGYNYNPKDVTGPANDNKSFLVIGVDNNTSTDDNAFFMNFITADGKYTNFNRVSDEDGAILVQVMIQGPASIVNDKASLVKPYLNQVADDKGHIGLSMAIQNIGANPVKQIKVDFSVKGGASVGTQTFNVDVPKFGFHRVEVDPLPIKNGQTLIATIKEINGTARDNEKGFELLVDGVVKEAFARKVLIEQYSTETCSSCPAAHHYLHTTLGEKAYQDRYVWVIHHDGFKPDKFYQEVSADMLYLYGANSVAAPAWSLDRTISTSAASIEEYGEPIHGLDHTENDLNRELLREAMARPAMLSVNIEENCDPATRKLNIKVSGQSFKDQLKPEEIDNIYLNIYIVEDNVFTRDQAGVGTAPDGLFNPFYHHGLIRKYVVNGAKGEKITLDDKGDYSYSTTVDLPEEWRGSNIRIVAYLAKKLGTDRHDRTQLENSQVYNSNETKLKAYASILPTAPEAVDTTLYARQGTITAAADAHIAAIYDLNGQQCTNGTLAAGVYVVVLQTPAGTFPCKVVML